MSTQHQRLKAGLFTNYLVHGFGMIILTQNLLPLAHNWSTSLATASYMLSGIGIGRLLAYLLMGTLSDTVGRKTVLLFGMVTYGLFFALSPLNHSLGLAYGLSVLAGVANSALDAGTYPLLAESQGQQDANAVLLKAFISIGEFILPLLIIALNQQQLWFGLSFYLPAALLLVNLLNIASLKITGQEGQVAKAKLGPTIPISRPKKMVVTAALLVYGYTAMAVMIWFTQWISIFAKSIGFSSTNAHLLLSAYSLGSITGALAVVLFLRRLSIKKELFFGMNLISLLSLATLTWVHVLPVAMGAAFCFGAAAAGGLMQMALTTLLSLFQQHKGLLTGLFFSFGSLASFSVPLITGWLVKEGQQNMLAFDVLIAALGLVIACIVTCLVPKEEQSLADARRHISQLDRRLIQLLDERTAAVSRVHQFKQVEGVPVEDLKREAVVLQAVAKNTNDPALIPYHQAVLQSIMDQSKKYQSSLK
ncbi:MFS transporter [Leuconostocaceae bacterium ESL0958]|nr:MFS transporter [Leuconostocaceae bacterium ESL0958]